MYSSFKKQMRASELYRFSQPGAGAQRVSPYPSHAGLSHEFEKLFAGARG